MQRDFFPPRATNPTPVGRPLPAAAPTRVVGPSAQCASVTAALRTAKLLRTSRAVALETGGESSAASLCVCACAAPAPFMKLQRRLFVIPLNGLTILEPMKPAAADSDSNDDDDDETGGSRA